jgi:hypothetical protein
VRGKAALMVALGAGLMATAPAGAASVAVNGTCFIEQEQIGASGAGFTPGAQVAFAFDGVAAEFGSASLTGSIFQQLTAPTLDDGLLVHTFNLTATDQNNPANVGSVPVIVTRFGAAIHPAQAPPGRRVKFAIRGMPPGKQVYLHYVLHGRVRLTVALGTPAGPCGTLNVKRRYFPIHRPAAGTWSLQFDQRKRYSSTTRPAIRGRVLLFHSASAAASMLR